MRASKESADMAKQRMSFIERKFIDAQKSVVLPHNVEVAFEEVRQFLNAAKRKLPTEAAYDRDTKRRSKTLRPIQKARA